MILCVMKKIFSSFALTALFLFTSMTSILFAADKRTDGPPGSEYGDFSAWDGQFSFAARFGASFLTGAKGSSDRRTGFLAGADLDYRPFHLFGFRASYEQTFKKPKFSLIQLTPLVHTEISNFRPYLFAGPGIGIASDADSKMKFSIAAGVGGDFMLIDQVGFGMYYTYYALFDSADVNTLGARISYWF